MDVVKRIEKAKRHYDMYGEKLKSDERIVELLNRLERAIERTWKYMREIGVTEVCRRCALEMGSCCKRWVEDFYDVDILLINLLLGVKLPEKRYREDLCFFCGENGCRLKAREVICVNFLCDRVLERIGEKEIELQKIAGEELETCFILQDEIKRRLSLLQNEQ